MYRVLLEIVTLELLRLFMMNYDYMTLICFIVCVYIIISFYLSFKLKHFMHCNLDVLILSTCPNISTHYYQYGFQENDEEKASNSEGEVYANMERL